MPRQDSHSHCRTAWDMQELNGNCLRPEKVFPRICLPKSRQTSGELAFWGWNPTKTLHFVNARSELFRQFLGRLRMILVIERFFGPPKVLGNIGVPWEYWVLRKKGPIAIKPVRGHSTIPTIFWVHRKLPQSKVNAMLEATRPMRAEQVVTVPLQLYFGFHWNTEESHVA